MELSLYHNLASDPNFLKVGGKKASVEGMTTQAIYETIISSLQNGQRPRASLDAGQLLSLHNDWQQALEAQSTERLRMCLCVAAHTSNTGGRLADLAVTSLSLHDPELLVLALSVAKNQVIDHATKTGDPYPASLITAIGNILKTPEQGPEVLEWVVRTLFDMGPRARVLYQDLLPHRPAFWQKALPAKRRLGEMIAELEKIWGQA